MTCSVPDGNRPRTLRAPRFDQEGTLGDEAASIPRYFCFWLVTILQELCCDILSHFSHMQSLVSKVKENTIEVRMISTEEY